MPRLRAVSRVDAMGHLFRQEHGDLGLERIGVLHFVDQNVREALAELVARRQTVPQHIAGEHQQVQKLHFSGISALLGIFEREAPE